MNANEIQHLDSATFTSNGRKGRAVAFVARHPNGDGTYSRALQIELYRVRRDGLEMFAGYAIMGSDVAQIAIFALRRERWMSARAA